MKWAMSRVRKTNSDESSLSLPLSRYRCSEITDLRLQTARRHNGLRDVSVIERESARMRDIEARRQLKNVKESEKEKSLVSRRGSYRVGSNADFRLY